MDIFMNARWIFLIALTALLVIATAYLVSRGLLISPSPEEVFEKFEKPGYQMLYRSTMDPIVSLSYNADSNEVIFISGKEYSTNNDNDDSFSIISSDGEILEDAKKITPLVDRRWNGIYIYGFALPLKSTGWKSVKITWKRLGKVIVDINHNLEVM